MKRLAAGTIAGLEAGALPQIPPRAAGVMYVCPLGYRAILREMRLVTSGATAGQNTDVVAQISGGLDVLVYTAAATAPVSLFIEKCALVLHPGDALFLGTLSPSVAYYLSGAEVPLPQ